MLAQEILAPIWAATSKPSPARYRTTNWPAYNTAMRRRGSLLVWLDREMEWLKPKRDRPGRPQTFSDAAIQFCLSLKVLFGLALRQAIGRRGACRRAGLDWLMPDYSTLCRRQETMGIQSPFRRVSGGINLLVDSTGVKRRGDDEWQVRRHGPSPGRQWRKVHLAMDALTGDSRAVEVTASREGGSPVLPDLLEQIPADQAVGTVTADGASDTRKCHAAIAGQGGTIIIPYRTKERPWEDGPAAKARNENLRSLRHLGLAF